MSEYYLEAKGIYKTFGGIHALENVSLRIGPGQVMCLAGENGCGKSTLIKIISGAYTADAGEIIIDGHSYDQMTPLFSTRAGIQVIYQDFSLFGNLSVAENIAMPVNLHQNRKGLFNKAKNRAIAEVALRDIGVFIDTNAMVDDLPIAQRQIVAICRALVEEAKLIIMDEPTTALTSKEVERLYAIIENLKSKNIALLFVSHKLDEVFRIAQHITVMRNGQNVTEGPAKSFDMKSLTYYMTGKEQYRAPFDNFIEKDHVLLKCENMRAKNDSFHNINFELYKGEVLGITGLLGSGRESLAEALFGLQQCKEGDMVLCGKKLKLKNASQAVREGIGYIPEDRAVKGLYLNAPIGENIISSVLFLYTKMNFLLYKKLQKVAQAESDNLRIKTQSLGTLVSNLSGGNQQRVVIAKWLALKPKLLVLNCPTVGVDIGSKSEIHAMAHDFAAKGIGVILISDDLPEILSACNRVLVMNHGEITHCFDTSEISENEMYEELVKA